MDPTSGRARLLSELKRRKVFRVAAVYAATAFVVWQASSFVLPALEFPDWSVDLVVVLSLLGFPLALVLAWAFEVTPEGMKRAEPLPATGHTDGAGQASADGGAGAGAGSVSPPASRATEPGWLGTRAAVLVGLLVLLGFALGAGWLEPLLPEASADGAPAEVLRSSLLPPPEKQFEGGHGLALSPDGRRLAFVTGEPRAPLWVRELDALEARPIPGTEGAGSPFWSPDGERVAFFAGRRLRVVDLRSGGLRTLARQVAGDAEGGTWNREGVILFAGRDGRIHRISESGGEATPVTTRRRDENDHERPFFLPDGRRFLFSLGDAVGVFVGDLEEEGRTRLLPRGGEAEYAPPGWLFFTTPEEAFTLFARRLDPDRLSFEGPPVPVAAELQTPFGHLSYSVSASGRLVYLARDLGTRAMLSLHVRRDGAVLDTLVPPDSAWQVRWSHAGDAVAFAGNGVWVRPVDRGITRRLPPRTSDYVTLDPVWAPEDSLIAYWTRPSRDSPRYEIWAVRPDGTGSRRLAELEFTYFSPSDWSPDGRYLLGTGREDESAAERSLRLLDLEERVLSTWRSEGHRFYEGVATFSPDGRWVAYEAGGDEVPEIYVAPFPGPGPRVRVSPNGGRRPRWRDDGLELYYVEPGAGLMAAGVAREDGRLQVSRLRPVSLDLAIEPGLPPPLPSPDGERFLVPRRLRPSGEPALPSPGALTLVLNWATELEVDGR